MDDPRKRNVVHHQADGQPAKMLQVISRNQGWITVNTKNPDRKHPVEKQALGDVKKVNVLSPTWMQLQYNKPGPDPLCQVGVKHGVRKETNRTFLVEKTQPQRSLFALGSVRHNVHFKHEKDAIMEKALKDGTITERAVNMLEWNLPKLPAEKVSPKIGSCHFV